MGRIKILILSSCHVFIYLFHIFCMIQSTAMTVAGSPAVVLTSNSSAGNTQNLRRSEDMRRARSSSSKSSRNSDSSSSISVSSSENKCETGRYQSPINLDSCTPISEKNSFTLPPLVFDGHFDVRPQGFLLVNNGEKALMLYPPGSVVTLRGGGLRNNYTLDRIELFWGQNLNEVVGHTLKGQEFVLEFTFLHHNSKYRSYEEAVYKKDGIAIMVLLFQVNDDIPDRCWESAFSTPFELIIEANSSVQLPSVALSFLGNFFTQEAGYYFYKGSNIKSPCLENVYWIISRKTASMTSEKMSYLQSLKDLNGNAIVTNRRLQQDRNGRVIYCA